MVKLSSFRVDSNKIKNGEWVNPNEDDFYILTRGFTDAYTNQRNAKLRKAARRYQGVVESIPQEVSRAITLEAIIEHCLLDVKGLKDGDKDIDIARFKELLYDPDYGPDLFLACIRAAAIVGVNKEEEVEEVKKNSVKS